jgi:hypothetical protein
LNIVELKVWHYFLDFTTNPGLPRQAPGKKLVEAAGQLIQVFRQGLDYTFILLPGCGAYYPRRRKAMNPSADSIPKDSASL